MVVTRHLLFALISAFLGIGAALSGIEFVLRHQAAKIKAEDQMDPGLFVFDSALGWRMAANWRGEHRHHDFTVRYRTNENGLRGPWPPSGSGLAMTPRCAFLGDSFTFGLGVDDGDTFVQQLNAIGLGRTFLNAGIAGYSTDQEYLYLKDRIADWRLRDLVLVVYLANDLLDNTLAYPLQAEMGKPVFVLDGGALRLTQVPVVKASKPPAERARTLATILLGDEAGRRSPSWLSRTEIGRRLGLSERADVSMLPAMRERMAYPVDLFVKLFGAIHDLCGQHRVTLSIVLMPGRSYVESPGSYSAAFQEELRERITARRAELGVPVMDLASWLRSEYERTGDRLFHPNEGHLNARGHRRVAERLAALLAGQGAAPPAEGAN